jgi:hypothetical protein
VNPPGLAPGPFCGPEFLCLRVRTFQSSRSFCTACGSTGLTSTGRRLPRNAHKEITGFPRHSGKDVPAGTVAVVRSLDAWRAPEGATALSTLIRQRHLTPSCGGHAPTAERTVGPARIVMESLTPKPGIREQYRHTGAISRGLGCNASGNGTAYPQIGSSAATMPCW